MSFSLLCLLQGLPLGELGGVEQLLGLNFVGGLSPVHDSAILHVRSVLLLELFVIIVLLTLVFQYPNIRLLQKSIITVNPLLIWYYVIANRN
jgi:hypothetical protein